MENRVFMLFFVLVSLSLFFSAFSAALLFVRRRTKMKFSPLVWAVFFLSFCVPLVLPFHLKEIKLYVNYSGGVRLEDVDYDGGTVGSERIQAGAGNPEHDIDKPGVYVSREVLSVLFDVCLVYIGVRSAKAAASLYLNFSSYFNTLHFLTKYSSECRDGRVLSIFKEAKRKAKIRRNIPLRVMKDNVMISPCTCGTVFPSVYIGRDQLECYSDEWLELLFLHELLHIRHGDSLMKIAANITLSFQLSLFEKKIRREIFEDAEYLCDEAVLRMKGRECLGEYMAMIIETAESGMKIRERDYLSPAAEKRPGVMMRRYRNMLSGEKNRKILALPTLSLMLVLNMALASAVSVVNYKNMGVDIVSPFMERSLCRYFGVGAEDLNEGMLARIYSAEFTLTGERITEDEAGVREYHVSCVINESGNYYTEVFPGKKIDARDVMLFTGLRFLVFSDRLRPADEDILQGEQYAVIVRN